jgi:hypothetical protein
MCSALHARVFEGAAKSQFVVQGSTFQQTIMLEHVFQKDAPISASRRGETMPKASGL